MPQAIISGFGHSTVALTELRNVTSAAEAIALLGEPRRRGVVPRGRGRSYGDAAQNSGGVTAVNRSGSPPEVFVDAAGLVTADASATIEDILHAIVPRGWFIPVTPGTARASLGGCLAADVHGKNHHADGTLGAHTTRLTLITPVHGTISASRGEDIFNATIGGMGLTGIIKEASFQAIRIDSAHMRVRRTRTENLHHTMRQLREADMRSRYSVAWLDLLARGSALGRGVVIEGDHASAADIPRRAQSRRLHYRPRSRATIPHHLPVNSLTRASVTLFNRLYYAASHPKADHLEDISTFFHPLDAIRDWNYLYGRRGFVQYQFVVPDTEDGSRAVVSAIEAITRSRYPGFLTVLKRFGPEGSGLLSFPRAGWTLTVDLPCGDAGLRALLTGLDLIVLAADGRIYLAKDAVSSPELITAMYPRLAEWQAIQRNLDPYGVMQSDMSRRLSLTAPHNAGENQ